MSPNGIPPNMPHMGYYLYPYNPFMGIPVPGGPMFMGGMWPHGIPPMSPMMPMVHQQSPVNGGGGAGRGGGRGRQGKHSPRNYSGAGGGKGAPHSPNGPQRARGSSYGSGKASGSQQGMGQQGPPQQGRGPTAFHASHAAPKQTGDGQDQGGGAGGETDNAPESATMHMPPGQTSPREGAGDDARDKTVKGRYPLVCVCTLIDLVISYVFLIYAVCVCISSGDGIEEVGGKGDKNRKKNIKNKKKDKSSASGGVSTGGVGGAEGVESGGNAERRGKGESSGRGGGRGGGREERKSPRGGRGGRGEEKPAKQPEFNMESDFPTLVRLVHQSMPPFVYLPM